MSATPHRCDVAVVGGGLAGATAAVAFARAGLAVRLFERRDLSRDPNRGDMLHAPTVAELHTLDLVDPLDRRGAIELQRIDTVNGGGDLLLRAPIAGTRILNHAEMEAVFLETAESVGTVVEQRAVREAARAEEGWAVTTDDGVTHARFLVGADGAESLVRSALGIEVGDVHEYDHRLVVLHADAPAWLEPGCGWTMFHPESALFMFPTTPAGRVRIIFTVAIDSVRDWMTLDDTAIADRLARRHPLLADLRVTKRGGSHVYRLRKSHATRYCDDAAAIIGDAAHTTHTMGGQGLNMAIQDAVVLARHVAPVLLDGGATDALTAALTAFEAERRPITTATLESAHRGATMCGPGDAAYERAVEFYRRVAADPRVLRETTDRGRRAD